MSHQINKVGIIGAGVMGANIAAHIASVGLPTVLLDIIPPSIPPELEKKKIQINSKTYRNYFSQKGLDNAIKSHPASFYTSNDYSRITIGNLEDDLKLLAECDWIIEVVVEVLTVKQRILSQIESIRKKNSIITTNTSGISIASMSKHLSEEFQKNFLGTHFFNPPRYMKLFEIIPGPKTDPTIITFMANFAEKTLGKGIVFAKDTPNFIANRIGIFGMCYINQLIDEMDFSFETADNLTGTILGRPKMATFRLGDLVGLDISNHVANNVYKTALNDERREIFSQPVWIKQMITNGMLGNKTKKGFYKKVKDKNGKKTNLVLDRKKMEYRNPEKVKFDSLELAKQQPDINSKIKTLFYGNDKAAIFTFKHITEGLIYAANRIPEISNDIINIDNSLKWGFNWKIGPFEIWDSLGLKKSVTKMKNANYIIPIWVEEMLAAGDNVFYKNKDDIQFYYDIASKTYKNIKVNYNIIHLPSLKAQNRIITSNTGASLIDLDDGIACLEFHSKMNSLGQDTITMVSKAADIVSKQFDGLILANHGQNFSVGANLMLILFTAQEEEWDELNFMVKTLQDSFMKLKYLKRPVVAAPHQMALGGGCEICLAADKIVAAAETYIGLVEVGVGVIPAGGGTKELLIRNTHEHIFQVPKGGIYPKQINLMPFVARTFETIAMAKVATSAKEAIQMGILRSTDQISVNSDYRIKKAKNAVLAMLLEDYIPPEPLTKIRVMGRDTMGTFKYVLYNMYKSGFITDHDVTVATKVAEVVTGGNVLPDTEVTEQYILDLEREAFLSLCGTKNTQSRIGHMLKTGKPLRN